jgi:hypothetical protein
LRPASPHSSRSALAEPDRLQRTAQKPAPVTSRKHIQKTASATGWKGEGIRTLKSQSSNFRFVPMRGSTEQRAIRARPLIDHHAQIVEHLDGGFYIAADGDPLGLGSGG